MKEPARSSGIKPWRSLLGAVNRTSCGCRQLSATATTFHHNIVSRNCLKYVQSNLEPSGCCRTVSGARQKGDSKREKPDPERTFSQIFADFRWFSARSVNQGIGEAQICAENHRKPQIFAGNRRFLQKPVRPGTKPIHAGKNSRGVNFARIHAGPASALARIQENIFEEVFPEYFAKFLGKFTRCEYMPRLYSYPREYRKIFLANYLCIRFVPRGTSSPIWCPPAAAEQFVY